MSGVTWTSGEIDTTGKVTLSDSYVSTIEPADGADAPKSCADLAKKGSDGKGRFSVPSPDDDGALKGGTNSFSLDVGIGAYTGPKEYTGDDVATDTGMELAPTAKISDNDSENANYGPNDGHAGKVVVNADGSGSFTFADWINPGSEAISGTITWTCSG